MKLSDDIGRMVHAFSDQGRKDEVRRMVALVRKHEAVADQARRLLHVIQFEPGDTSEAAMLECLLDAIDKETA